MQLASDEGPVVVVEEPPVGRNVAGIESHGIRVLTPSEIMRTLPSIGTAANNGVQHAQHPNLPSGPCPSPALPLQQQHHHHHHLHQQQHHHHHQYLHHHPVALQQHLQQQQQQQQQLHHHHPAVMTPVHFVGLKYRPGNSCGMRIFGMDSIDRFWMDSFHFDSTPFRSPPPFLFRWNFSLFDFLGYSFFPRMSGGINPSTHVSFFKWLHHHGHLILLISFGNCFYFNILGRFYLLKFFIGRSVSIRKLLFIYLLFGVNEFLNGIVCFYDLDMTIDWSVVVFLFYDFEF
jgi:hypothetical protein